MVVFCVFWITAAETLYCKLIVYTLMELARETVKRIDSSNISNKTATVAMAAVRTGLGGNEMTATAAAQDCLVISIDSNSSFYVTTASGVITITLFCGQIFR